MKIKVKNISKSYKQKKTERCILKDFTYIFESGKLYVMKGESGRGKTTLLSIIGLLRKPDKGSISFDETQITELPDRKREQFRNREIGFVFQNYNLFRELTVIDNMILGEVCSKKLSMREAKIQAEMYLELLGLKGRENTQAKFLSGGEQQRTSIARALMKEFQLLICDEPVSNLDEKNTAHIVKFIDDLCHRENKIVIVSSHDRVFDQIADEIIQL